VIATLFHIALPDEWEAAKAGGSYDRSTRGRSLAEEGFIHCSYRHQVEATANRFYADVAELVVLTLDGDRIGSPIVEEAAVEAGELFPHVYGPIPVEAVVAATPLARDANGWCLAPPVRD
jgi:glutathione S-transferase